MNIGGIELQYRKGNGRKDGDVNKGGSSSIVEGYSIVSMNHNIVQSIGLHGTLTLEMND